MAGELHEFLSRDHERLDGLLAACVRGDGTIDMESYDAFRRGLLRHISIEERVLFPELRKRFGRMPVEIQLHRDHAALTALLVPPPTAVEVGQIGAILGIHNDLEERGGGMYEDVEALDGIDMADLMRRVHAIAQVPVLPNVDNEVVRRSIAQLLREAEDGRRALLGS